MNSTVIQYIDKSKVIAEIERIKKQYLKTTKIDSRKKTGKGKIKKSGKGDGNGKTEYKVISFFWWFLRERTQLSQVLNV